MLIRLPITGVLVIIFLMAGSSKHRSNGLARQADSAGDEGRQLKPSRQSNGPHQRNCSIFSGWRAHWDGRFFCYSRRVRIAVCS
jgi:hypothetical protein